MAKSKKKGERIEAIIRIAIFLISGFILLTWRTFIYLLVVFNLFHTLILGKRLKMLAEMGEIWNTQMYIFQRYIIFESNRRPFPFRKLERKISKFEK